MVKLAILDTDILYDPLQEKFDSYGKMFKDLLHGVGVADAGWDLAVYPVINGKYPASPSDHDAYLITGSKYDSFSDEDWIVRLRDYVRELYQSGKPMVGVCFGHQLLAHSLGGRTDRSDAGWGLGVMAYHVHPQGWFTQLPETVSLIASHQDQVKKLPPDAQLLLSNDFCPFAAFHIPNKVLAIQGHPEFTVDYTRALLDYRAEKLPADALGKARESLANPHNGRLVGQWIREFVERAV